jgi:hypothetical protein
MAYKVGDVYNIIGRTAHEAVFEPRYHLEQLLEDSMFLMLSGAWISMYFPYEELMMYLCMNISAGCSASSPIQRIPLLRRVLIGQNNMHNTTKVSAMVHKWICSATDAKYIQT